MAVKIVERAPWKEARLIFIIGPGGAGKSSLGLQLAPLLNRQLIDLDHEFCVRIAPIGEYMRDAGYAEYKRANSVLARQVTKDVSAAIVVTSSGFLSLDNASEILEFNCETISKGYSISLLPADDIKTASNIIVQRQLKRSFSPGAKRERQIIRERFDLYHAAGEMLVISAELPEQIAAALAKHLAK